MQGPISKRYRLGIKLWEIGCAAVNFRENAESARPFLHALMEACGETVHLGMISPEDPSTVVYIDRVDSAEPVRIVTALGSRAPSHSSAMGKAILAHNERFESTVVAKPLAPVTSHTITDPVLLKKDFAETRQRGYSIGKGEFNTSPVNCPSWRLIRSALRFIKATASFSWDRPVAALRNDQHRAAACHEKRCNPHKYSARWSHR